jgi:hypothetical protein
MHEESAIIPRAILKLTLTSEERASLGKFRV